MSQLRLPDFGLERERAAVWAAGDADAATRAGLLVAREEESEASGHS